MIDRRPFAAFGNSTGDQQMPEYLTTEYNTSGDGTDHENSASIDREDGATRGGRVGLRLIGAYCHAARHAAECAA
jgi:hypothetical protein